MYIECNVGLNHYKFRELTVKEYKEILKVTYGDSPSLSLYLTNICDTLKDLFSKNYEYFFSEISIFEIFLLLLQLRINSLGTKTSISITNKEQKKHIIDLNLNTIFEDLNNLLLLYTNQQFTLNDNIEVEISLPSIYKLRSQINDPYFLFVKQIKITTNNNFYVLKDWLHIQSLINNFSAKQTLHLNEYLNNLVKEVNSLNLLEAYNVDTDANMIFGLSLDSLLWFTKLIFNEDLDIFYSNLFYLGYTGHMNAEFIEACTPGEYLYFVRKLQETISKQNKGGEQPQSLAANGEALSDPNQFFDDKL
jgi:hypothetical protein